MEKSILNGQMPKFKLITLSSCVLVALSGTTATAQSEFLWTGMAGANSWNDENNWSNLSAGGIVSGFPSLADSANFLMDATVFGGEVLDISIGVSNTVTLGQSSSSATTIAGVITNNGTLTFAQDQSGNNVSGIDQRLFIASGTSATINGSGFLIPNGTETGIQGGGALLSSLTNASGHTITGDGWFQDISIVNQGVIKPSFGGMAFANTDVQGDGVLEIANTGKLWIGSGAVIHDTTINGVVGSVIGDWFGSGSLRDIVLEGSLIYGQSSSSATTIAGVITNNGTLTFAQDQSGNNVSGIDQRLFIASGTSATINGNGSLVLNGNETGIQGGGPLPATFTNASGHTITGAGWFQDISIVNQGVIDPSGPGRVMSSFTPTNFDFTSSGELVADLGGVSNGSYDRISIGSAASSISLGGTLTVNLDDGYEPGFGSLWSIINGGTHTGEFAAVNLPEPPQDLVYRIVYEPDRAYIVLTCPADFTNDFTLNFFDISAFLEAFAAQDPIADFNGDGRWNFFDISAFLEAFAAGCP